MKQMKQITACMILFMFTLLAASTQALQAAKLSVDMKTGLKNQKGKHFVNEKLVKQRFQVECLMVLSSRIWSL